MKQLLVFSAFFAVFSISAQNVDLHNHGTFPQKMDFGQLFKIGNPCQFTIHQTETDEHISVNADTLDFNAVSLGKVSDATMQIVTAQDSITHYQVETNSVTATQQLIEQTIIDYGKARTGKNENFDTFYNWRIELPNGKTAVYKLTVNKERSHGILHGTLE